MPLDDQTITEIVESYRAGNSSYAVARQLGVSKTTVRRYVTEAGISRTSQQGQSIKARQDYLPHEPANVDVYARNKNNCKRELEALKTHHRPIWRKNLIAAYKAKAAAARGIDVAATGRDYAQRLEAVSVEIRSSGNGEAV